MALQTTTTIKIGELVVHNFSHLKIVQKIHAHHKFSFEIGQELLETKFQSNVPASGNLKGQRISIEIKAIPELDDLMLVENKNDYTLQFYGIVDKVRMRKSTLTDNEQVLVITGYSETILLDNGADCNSFTGMTLEAIVNQVKSRYGIDFHVNPFYKDIIPYTVQYNESDFDLLNRLSKLHAQWFYSNGRTIVLGTPGGLGASPTLVYDINMQDFIYDMKLVPALFKTIENDNRTGESFMDQTAKYGNEVNGFHEEYLDRSNQIFNRENVIQPNQNASPHYTRNKMRSILGDMMKIKVISEVPGVTLGNTVTIKGVDKQHETTYRITEITHTCDDSGGYENHFKAINLSGAVFSPKTNPDLVPYSPSQSAIVVNTEDPDGLSAVIVQMSWQKIKGTTTPYIPVLQQYGGSEKGSHWVPEIGETVYVEFQGGNAEMPIVTGSLTSIKEKSGYATPNNDIKALHTRSNNRLVMNDKAGSMLLQDSSKSYLQFDGKRQVELNADVFVVNVKRLIFNASESTEINTNDYMLTALTRIYIFSKTLKQTIQGFMNLYSGKALINSDDAIDIEAKKTKVHGTEHALIHSDKEAVINSKGTATMHADLGNNYSNTALTVDAAATEVVALAVVYFRPLSTWKGEFGFDWLREKDNGLTIEPDYQSIIEGGYKNGKSDLDKIEAFTQLQTEYDSITITRKTPDDTVSTHYFVPYLTLFSQEFVKSMPKDTLVVPQYEAELKILLEIEEDLEKIKFDYDDTLFRIDATKLTQNKKTQGLTDRKISIKIKCLKDLDSNKYINIYAYPKGTEPNKEIENRKLAGRITVLKNDSTVRKEQKFVLVNVITNVANKELQKAFTPEEKYKLFEGMHQALILPIIEETILNLSNHPDFQINGKHVDEYGHLAYLDKNNYDLLNPYLHHDVRSIFLEDNDSSGTEKKIKYFDCFTIFKFAIGANDPLTAGAAQGINVKNVIIFKTLLEYKNATLIHETLHGLGLWHTHKGKNKDKPLPHKNFKYIYPMGVQKSTIATNNIMSYADDTFTSWQWQWRIANSNIKVK
ncbi:hypothetical protein KHA90_00985 [Flavobacterium psychroterrae]|uniref:Gp5/Type VI secretion system Vgr protein OB-fold domain-containing protein n=1 Tax=Flavobacterium psychroterrae TaxID=2133767 RepID=A0ABS5P5R3_9FLAO|nr:phage baseplate assembly protein V [Flavobacterium psychroterrae]MBS7229584.1 hypothetical protein [Flavobacterium psychroterrae]